MPLIEFGEIGKDTLWGIWKIEESTEELLTLFGSKELEIPEFKVEIKLKEWLASRILVKNLLKRGGKDFTVFLKDVFGKPFIQFSEEEFSISHSKGYTAAIINGNKRTGIDIEKIDIKIQRVAPRILSEIELAGAEGDLEKLTVLWCCKEVLYKVFSKRGLEFKENLIIQPFQYNRQEGECFGIVRTEDSNETFKIQYKKRGEFMLAMCY